ncbi:amidohydrolase family protein [Streptomyces blattellae]|uniref:amidohydrolase family protein n=1 Tax=Streptomyces blattellae TaxID=2569855 RepID=UPI001E40852A|nr:amidohydrolase family protein [Streptomyces blattellae]
MTREERLPARRRFSRRNVLKVTGATAVGGAVPLTARDAAEAKEASASPAAVRDGMTKSRTRITGIEEHCTIPELLDAWSKLGAPWSEDPALQVSAMPQFAGPLADAGDARITAMDATGIDTQVLSLPPPGLQILDQADAVALQRIGNDRLAELVRAHPDRLQAFAALATSAPEKAAAELERAVRELGFNGAMLLGRTREHTLDHTDMWPVFEAAEALNVPLYLHPQTPPLAVRDTYYQVDSPAVSTALSLFGIGWHYDTGVQLLRLIFNGVFDRFPNLQVISGHWGEVVLFYLERIEEGARLVNAPLKRPVIDYFRENMYFTPSGMYSERYLRWTVEMVGADRIIFASDYPFQAPPEGGMPEFVRDTGLSPADQAKFASGNWEGLIAGIKR